MVYSWGKDVTRSGVLGISKGIHEQLKPAPLYSLIDYSITSVNIDAKKAWAIDKSGKLFIWGSYNTTQLFSESGIPNNENLITNDIVIPQPMHVAILKNHPINKATPFASRVETEEIGTNICFKTTDSQKVNSKYHF